MHINIQVMQFEFAQQLQQLFLLFYFQVICISVAWYKWRVCLCSLSATSRSSQEQ